jgi:hypothetical protein
MCGHGMTSYTGAAWRLKRATMSISTMGAIVAAAYLRTVRQTRGPPVELAKPQVSFVS